MLLLMISACAAAKVTSPNCASPRRRVSIDNAGFVPLCLNSFRYEGEACSAFHPVEEPEIDGCLHLEPEDAGDFVFQYQPTELGRDECTLVVDSDSMNVPSLEVPLVGNGVEVDTTVDEEEVGDLNPNRRAYFGMRRPAVEASVRVFLDDEANDAWEFDEGANAIFFERARDHPNEGTMLRIEYDARCFDRIE